MFTSGVDRRPDLWPEQAALDEGPCVEGQPGRMGSMVGHMARSVREVAEELGIVTYTLPG